MSYLRDCPKPELVEHGGNLCPQNGRLGCQGVGVKCLSNIGRIVEEVGTSLAAPLVAQHMARIWQKFTGRIHNVETVKAILLSTCEPTVNHPRYVGFGEPEKTQFFSSKRNVVRLVFEGNLSLSATALGSKAIPVDEIKLFVPASVETIEVFLVHSDDYIRNSLPKLNTYVKVLAEKPGLAGLVKPKIGLSSSRTHAKYMLYEYKRNIKGDWFFRLVPAGIQIPSRERKAVNIRYGCVIKLTAKNQSHDLRRSFLHGTNRGRSVQIPLDAI